MKNYAKRIQLPKMKLLLIANPIVLPNVSIARISINPNTKASLTYCWIVTIIHHSRAMIYDSSTKICGILDRQTSKVNVEGYSIEEERSWYLAGNVGAVISVLSVAFLYGFFR